MARSKKAICACARRSTVKTQAASRDSRQSLHAPAPAPPDAAGEIHPAPWFLNPASRSCGSMPQRWVALRRTPMRSPRVACPRRLGRLSSAVSENHNHHIQNNRPTPRIDQLHDSLRNDRKPHPPSRVHNWCHNDRMIGQFHGHELHQ